MPGARMAFSTAAALIWCLLVAAAADAAPQRVALIIGNATYVDVPYLRNPINDAEAMTRALRELGFEVILHKDATRKTMLDAIDAFRRRLGQAEVALFYYSGHGAQRQGRNYLIPISARINTGGDLPFEAVEAQRVLANMEDGGSKLNIVILDACRDNPFKGWSRSLGKGLAIMDRIEGSVIAYATQPGNVASDGVGDNSPYTQALLENLRKPGLTVQEMFRKVGQQVMQATKGDQRPWYESSPTGDFCFAGCASPVAGLLRACAAHLAANRLTSGVGGTALACYDEVLRPGGVKMEFKSCLETSAPSCNRRLTPSTAMPNAASARPISQVWPSR